MTEDRIRLREEISEQIRALSKMKEMAASYGVDISKPAKNAKEAVQAVYMGYLAGTKENNGAALRSIWQQGVHPEAGRRHDGNIPKLHKQAGKAHNQVAEVRDATDDVRRKKRGIAL